MDSGTTAILMSDADSARVHAAVPGLSYNAQGGYYAVTGGCDAVASLPDITFVLGGKALRRTRPPVDAADPEARERRRRRVHLGHHPRRRRQLDHPRRQLPSGVVHRVPLRQVGPHGVRRARGAYGHQAEPPGGGRGRRGRGEGGGDARLGLEADGREPGQDEAGGVVERGRGLGARGRRRRLLFLPEEAVAPARGPSPSPLPEACAAGRAAAGPRRGPRGCWGRGRRRWAARTPLRRASAPSSRRPAAGSRPRRSPATGCPRPPSGWRRADRSGEVGVSALLFFFSSAFCCRFAFLLCLFPFKKPILPPPPGAFCVLPPSSFPLPSLLLFFT